MAETTLASASKGDIPVAEVAEPKGRANVTSPEGRADATAPVALGARARRVAGTFFVLFFLYLALDWLFFLLPEHQQQFAPSPFFCVAPVVGLYLGWPAIFGSFAAESLLVVFMQRPPAPVAALAVPTLLVFLALPYVAWYAVTRKSPHPYPRCDGAFRLALCIVLLALSCLIWGVVCAWWLLEWTNSNPLDPAFYLRLIFFTDFGLSTIIGVPLLILLEASPVVPRAPRWIRVPYQQHATLNLTQRLVFVFAAIMVFMLVTQILPYHDQLASEEVTYGVLVEVVGSALVYGGEVAVIIWAFVVGVMVYLQTRFTWPIERLSAATRRFPAEMAAYQAAADEDTPKDDLARLKSEAADPVAMAGLRPTSEVAFLVEDTDAMRASIVSYLDDLKAVTAENERVRAELDIATQIQMGAVPHEFAELESRLFVEVAASMTPAREVGGDFYDAFALGPSKLGVIMADVSGKGMPAALFMMRALASLRESMLAIEDMGEALTKANQALCENNDAMLFVTAFICALDVKTGEVAFANAGHNPAWRLGLPGSADGAGTWVHAKPGLVLGVMDLVRFKTETLRLQPGEGLFLYTDGVTEAMDPANALYGEPRLNGVLNEAESVAGGEASSQVVLDDVLADVARFASGAPQADDITALAFRWLPEGGVEGEA